METIDLTTFELNAAMRTTAAELLAANGSLRRWSREYAKRHSTYKKNHAKSRLASERKTDDQKKAEADYATADELLKSDLAEGMRQAELERVRSLRAVLSSLQTEANGNREESQYTRTGPQYER